MEIEGWKVNILSVGKNQVKRMKVVLIDCKDSDGVDNVCVLIEWNIPIDIRQPKRPDLADDM